MILLQEAIKDIEKATNAFLDKLQAVLFDTHFAQAKEDLQELINLSARVGALQQIYALLPPKEETDAKD